MANEDHFWAVGMSGGSGGTSSSSSSSSSSTSLEEGVVFSGVLFFTFGDLMWRRTVIVDMS